MSTSFRSSTSTDALRAEPGGVVCTAPFVRLAVCPRPSYAEIHSKPDKKAPCFADRAGGDDINSSVRDVMTKSVVFVRKDASFKDMAAMLRSQRISAFPVLDGSDRVIGVVSAGDLLVKEAVLAEGSSLLAALRHLREDDKAGGFTAADLMTTPAVTIGPDASVAEAARVMYDRKVKRLPVVNHAGHLMGIISRVDVLAVFSRSDSEIRDEVTRAVLPGIAPAAAGKLDVEVRDGIVTISGCPQSDATSRAIIEAVGHVQGVVGVRNRFS